MMDKTLNTTKWLEHKKSNPYMQRKQKLVRNFKTNIEYHRVAGAQVIQSLYVEYGSNLSEGDRKQKLVFGSIVISIGLSFFFSFGSRMKNIVIYNFFPI